MNVSFLFTSITIALVTGVLGSYLFWKWLFQLIVRIYPLDFRKIHKDDLYHHFDEYFETISKKNKWPIIGFMMVQQLCGLTIRGMLLRIKTISMAFDYYIKSQKDELWYQNTVFSIRLALLGLIVLLITYKMSDTIHETHELYGFMIILMLQGMNMILGAILGITVTFAPTPNTNSAPTDEPKSEALQ